MSYSQTAISGFSWTTILRGSIRLIIFFKIALLARLLLPEQFGLFGIITLVLAFLEMLTETGINVILLQQDDQTDKYFSTAWVISIVRGVIISLLIILSAPLISDFFHSPAAKPLLFLASIIPLIRGFINPACINLQKKLLFNTEFAYRISIVIFETVTSVLLIYHFKSPIGLVLGLILAAIFEVILSFKFIRPHPSFSFDKSQAASIIQRGKWVTGFGLFDYLFTTLDNIIVGRILGTAALGIYQNAYKLSLVPMGELSDIFYKVTFPLYVKMHQDHKLVQKTVFKVISLHLSLVFVSSSLLYIFAPGIVTILLGPNWITAIPVVKALSLLGIVRGISYSFNSLFMAFKLQHLVTIFTLVSVIGLGITIVPLVNQYGILGAAFSALIGSLAALPVAVFFMLKIPKHYLQR